ncbi:MAG: histidine phosphatase family protein [Planctomycetota bacterium]
MLSEPEDFARLILLRHPQLADPDRELALGRRDGELARRGRAQTLEVLRALAGLRLDAVWSAPARHCREAAAALVADLELEVGVDERLADQDLGDWSGLRWDEIRARDEALLRDFFADYGLVAPPGGERLADTVDRALDWWNEQAEAARGRTWLLVLPAPILGGLAARLLGLSLRRAPALSLPAAALGILDVFRDGAVLRSWHPLCLRDDMP